MSGVYRLDTLVLVLIAIAGVVGLVLLFKKKPVQPPAAPPKPAPAQPKAPVKSNAIVVQPGIHSIVPYSLAY